MMATDLAFDRDIVVPRVLLKSTEANTLILELLVADQCRVVIG